MVHLIEEELRIEFNKRIKTLKLDKSAKEELFGKVVVCFKDDFVCFYCKERMNLKWGSSLSFSIDHTIPRKLGGKDEIQNLEVICAQCNEMKGDKQPDWFFRNVKRLKERKRRREEQKAIRATVKDERKREAYKDIFQRLNAKKERKNLP